MNTKEQLEVVARYGGWEWDDELGGWYVDDDNYINELSITLNAAYDCLMPEWQKVRPLIDPDHHGAQWATADALASACRRALTEGTLSDFLASLSNAILWIESNKK